MKTKHTKAPKTNTTATAYAPSHWTREAAAKIKATAANTIPPFNLAKLKTLMPGWHFWDWWYAMNEQNQVANVGGYTVIVGLARPVDDAESANARMVFFYSKDGLHYTAGGYLFGEKRLFDDCQEWSGSTLLRDDGKLQTFYTVAQGVELSGNWQTRQRFATAIQNVTASDTALVIDVPHYHDMLAEPDGRFYETAEQASLREVKFPTAHSRSFGSDQTENTCFRDILYYKCPRTGRRFGLFEANTGTEICPAGSVKRAYIGSDRFEPEYEPTIDDLKANGCIGILEFTDDENTFVEFMPPLLTANLVTDEIERINIIDHDGHVYLFCVGHGNKNTLVTHNDDLSNRDYLLGFRGKSLFGPFEPMNGSGVVVQQKSLGAPYAGQEQNQQYVYSWKLVPTAKAGVFDCVGYANYSTNESGQVVPVKSAAPTLEVRIKGLQSDIVGMKYDVQPVQEAAPQVAPADAGTPSAGGYGHS